MIIVYVMINKIINKIVIFRIIVQVTLRNRVSINQIFKKE